VTSRQATSEYMRKAGPAVHMVGRALRTGRLERLPCADCGDPATQGYDVVWLCRTHHLSRHNRLRRPPWARPGQMRAYVAATRHVPYPGRTFHYSELSSPPNLFKNLERIWNLLATDEERAWAFALIERLAKEQAA